MKARREMPIYPVVARWMKRHFLCFKKDKLGVRVAPESTNERRFVCRDCVAKVLAIQEKRIKSWVSLSQRNPRKTVPGKRESVRPGA